MVGADDRDDRAVLVEQRTEDTRADHRVLHDVPVLLVAQRAALVEHLLADADLADIVEVAAERQGVEGVRIEAQLAADGGGVLRHADRVPLEIGVLGLERFRPRARLLAGDPFPLEQPHENPPQARLVVHDQAPHRVWLRHVCVTYGSLARRERRPYVPAMTRAFDHDLLRRFATRAVHAGQAPDPLAGAVMMPIYQTSTYIQDGLGRNKGYEYARTRNPTREALERNVAALEGGRHGFAFGSGLAAVDTVLKLLSAGDHVVCGENVYGGTHRQMTHIWARPGLAFAFVDGADTHAIAAAVTPETRMLFAETPTNPMMG